MSGRTARKRWHPAVYRHIAGSESNPTLTVLAFRRLPIFSSKAHAKVQKLGRVPGHHSIPCFPRFNAYNEIGQGSRTELKVGSDRNLS